MWHCGSGPSSSSGPSFATKFTRDETLRAGSHPAGARFSKDASRLETQGSRTSPRARSLAERIAKPEES